MLVIMRGIGWRGKQHFAGTIPLTFQSSIQYTQGHCATHYSKCTIPSHFSTDSHFEKYRTPTAGSDPAHACQTVINCVPGNEIPTVHIQFSDCCTRQILFDLGSNPSPAQSERDDETITNLYTVKYL